jgi:hypothetical protein
MHEALSLSHSHGMLAYFRKSCCNGCCQKLEGGCVRAECLGKPYLRKAFLLMPSMASSVAVCRPATFWAMMKRPVQSPCAWAASLQTCPSTNRLTTARSCFRCLAVPGSIVAQ